MRVLIVGAGIAGLTLAFRLKKAGHDLVVMERHPDLRDDGYMIDFFGPGVDAADHMGLLADLRALHYPIRHLRFIDAHGRPTAEVPYATLRRTIFGDQHFNFLRGDLERLLYEELRDAGGTVRFGTAPIAIEETASGVHVHDSRGHRHSVDLVVGADGVRSTVRALAFASSEWRYVWLGCRTAAYIIPGTIPGLLPDSFVTMSAAAMTACAYPIRGNRTAAFFVYRTSERLQHHSRDLCRRELEARFRGRGTLAESLLDALPSEGDLYFDDVVQVDADRWHTRRSVLVGDAAACLSLVAGQGASMAVAEAYVLSREITLTTSNVLTAFQRYEARLRPAVRSRQRAGRRNARWFLPGSDLWARLRDRAFALAIRPPFSSVVRRSIGGLPIDDGPTS